jgi:hypothetical protein
MSPIVVHEYLCDARKSGRDNFNNKLMADG